MSKKTAEAKTQSDVPPKLGRLFSTSEAAGYLGMSVTRLRRSIATHKIRCLRDGRLGIYQQWCDEFIERRSTGTTEPSKALRVERPSGIADLPASRLFPRAMPSRH